MSASASANDTTKTNMAATFAETAKTTEQANESDTLESVKPVFIMESDVFGEVHAKQFYILKVEMYRAVGGVVLERSIKGLQRVNCLWRIYHDS